METLILFAGLGQLAIAAGSLAIPKVLDWRAETKKLSPLTHAVFWTYAGYIWATNVFLGVVSCLAPRAWLDGSVPAQALCAYAAVYWVARIVIQVGWFGRVYSPPSRVLRFAEVGLLVGFAYLGGVYVLALVGGW